MNILRQNNIYGSRVTERALNAKLLENLKKKEAEEDGIVPTEKTGAENPGRKADSIEISAEGRLAADKAVSGELDKEDDKKVEGAADQADGKKVEGAADQTDGKKVEGAADQAESSEKQSGKVAVNEGKRRRQIAAAQSRGQLQQVLALLQGDLSDCKAGLEKGWCDESEIAKVEALIAAAKERMSQVPQESREDSQCGLDAFAMASLM